MLCILSWGLKHPPLSWLVALNNWVAASNRRLAAALTLSVLTVAGTIAWKLSHG